MKIDDLIKLLKQAKNKYGNLDVGTYESEYDHIFDINTADHYDEGYTYYKDSSIIILSQYSRSSMDDRVKAV